jgi:hypothetical protein
MKFSQVIKNQTVNYRLCDELTCKSIAMHVADEYPELNHIEHHLCETHYLRYKAELSQANAK